MSFSNKVEKIEQARKIYPAFNEEFIEYLGLGNSFNGAYNYFTLEHIEAYNPKVVKKPTPSKSAVKTKVVETVRPAKV